MIWTEIDFFSKILHKITIFFLIYSKIQMKSTFLEYYD